MTARIEPGLAARPRLPLAPWSALLLSVATLGCGGLPRLVVTVEGPVTGVFALVLGIGGALSHATYADEGAEIPLPVTVGAFMRDGDYPWGFPVCVSALDATGTLLGAGCAPIADPVEAGDRVDVDVTLVPVDDGLGLCPLPGERSIVELDDGVEAREPTLTADLLHMWFFSYANGDPDIFTASRPDVGSPWSPPLYVPELSSSAADYAPAVSDDGLILWLQSARGPTRTDIYVSSRASLLDPWGTPVLVPELSDPERDEAPAEPFDGGTKMIFHRGDWPSDTDLYLSTRATLTDPWSEPEPLPEFATDHVREATPFVTEDGLRIVYSSGTGRGILWTATRASVTDPFGAPAPVDCASRFTDTPDGWDPVGATDPWLAPDGSALFLSCGQRLCVQPR